MISLLLSVFHEEVEQMRLSVTQSYTTGPLIVHCEQLVTKCLVAAARENRNVWHWEYV